MQTPSQIIITASGRSNPIPLDYYVNGYAIAVTMKTAGAQYTVQQCFDDPFANYTTSYNVSGAWLPSDDPIVVNASTSRTTNFAFIPRAVRVFASAGVSAGNPLTFTVIANGAY